MTRRIFCLILLLLALMSGCADRSVEVSAKGQIVVGGSVGKGL